MADASRSQIVHLAADWHVGVTEKGSVVVGLGGAPLETLGMISPDAADALSERLRVAAAVARQGGRQ